MVKIIFSVVIVLCVCSKQTTAWFGGGGSSDSNSGNNGGGSDKGNNGGGSDEGTSVDAGVEASKDGGASVSAGVSHKGDGWSGGVKGKVGSDGNWEVQAGVSIELGKRSVDWNGRHFTVRLDPCNFDVYDVNKDGVIVKSEIQAIFGGNTKADALFEALDITTGDGRIEEEEFYFMLPVTIKECQDMVQLPSH